MKQAIYQRQRGEEGIGMVLGVLTLGIILALCAMCVDMGRVYIAKNELQTYADAATLAANAELDGTDEGIDRARQAGLTWPNKWNFGMEDVPTPTVYFAKYAIGPWEQYPADPAGVQFAQVVVAGPVPLYFAPVFELFEPADAVVQGGTTAAAQLAGGGPMAFLQNAQYREAVVVGRAGAGQIRQTRFAQGLFPYSPNAHTAPSHPATINSLTGDEDPFNFEVGSRYTFRWPPPGHVGDPATWCEGDRHMSADFPMANGSERGFIDIGDNGSTGSNGSAFIRQAILNGTQSRVMRVGEPIINVPGQRETEVRAVKERIAYDTDSVSGTYAEYLVRGTGSGRRLVYMPVNNPYSGDLVVEFATFFLPPASEVCGAGNNRPCCAEYVGVGLIGSDRHGAAEEVGVSYSRLID